MKLLLIRHGRSSMEWEKRYTPAEYNDACEQYDKAGILPAGHPQETGDYERIYVSTLTRAIQTAEQMFPSAPPSMIVQTHLLDEVPMTAFTDTDRSYPRWVYDVMGRIQWREGKRQKETREETRRRADELIRLLEEKNENAILISHGFFLRVLIGQIKSRKRYEIYRSGTFVISPLEKIKVTDRQPHCGGCRHNCALSEAKCLIGQDKARQAGKL